MSETAAPMVKCPACGRLYRWNSEFAHQRFRCKCSARFVMPGTFEAKGKVVTAELDATPLSAVPNSPGEAKAGDARAPLPDSAARSSITGPAVPAGQRAGDLTYGDSDTKEEELPVLIEVTEAEIALAPPSPPAKEFTFDIETPIKETAPVPPVPPPPRPPGAASSSAEEGYDIVVPVEKPAAAPRTPELYRMLPGPQSSVAKALEERADDQQASVMLEMTMPWCTIVGGLFLSLVAWVYMGKTPLIGLGLGAMVIFIQVLLFLPLTLLAATLTTRLFNAAFGEGTPLFVKLAAVTLGPAAIADVISVIGCLVFCSDPGVDPILVSLGSYIVLSMPVLMLLFKLDSRESSLMGVIFGLPRMIVAMLLAWAGQGLLRHDMF